VTVALPVERFGNSSGTNHKLEYTTFSNAFSFHSSAFRFVINVTEKWCSFRVYTLYFIIFYIQTIKIKPAVDIPTFISQCFENVSRGQRNSLMHPVTSSLPVNNYSHFYTVELLEHKKTVRFWVFLVVYRWHSSSMPFVVKPNCTIVVRQ
jgi:hypothetical protein